jgi:3-oxoacyl-[acyl-carrier-protein] synthase-3
MTKRERRYIVGSGHAHPDRILTNEDLEATVPGLEPGWIARVLGSHARRVLAPHEHLPDLAERALVGSLRRQGWEGDAVDLVVCGTSFVDDLLPATASLVARRAAPAALAFDVNAACASGLYALAVADSLLAQQPHLHRAAVVVAERPTAWADYQNRESSVFWGDAAGCLLVSTDPGRACFEVVGVELINDNEHAEKVRVRRGGTFEHDGRYSYQQVVKLTHAIGTRLLESVGAVGSDLAAYVGHQSNLNLLAAVGEQLGIPWDRQWHNVEWAGNQGGAGVITAFSQGWDEHHGTLADGDLVLVTAVGGGYSSGGALLRWLA